jgi:hypothetical protein
MNVLLVNRIARLRQRAGPFLISQTPLVHLIETPGRLTNISAAQITALISAYTARNAMAHGPLASEIVKNPSWQLTYFRKTSRD